MSLLQVGDICKALEEFDLLLMRYPTHSEALNNSAVLLARGGNVAEALRRLRLAVDSSPHYGQAYFNLALVLRELGNNAAAYSALSRAVECEPRRLAWRAELARCALMLGHNDDALLACDALLAHAPSDADVMATRAVALHRLGRQPEAMAVLHEVIELDPHIARVYANLALLYKSARAWTDSEQVLLRGLRALPEDPLLLQDLATLYLQTGNVAGSLEAAQRLHSAHSANPEGFNSIGGVMFEIGELDEARASFTHAIALDPENVNAQWNLALLDLLDGNLTDGFRRFEIRRTVDSMILPRRSLPGIEWDGSALDGRSVFVHSEQGLGDLLQFIRYAPELKRRGAGRVIVEAPPEAASLLRTAPGIDELAFAGAPIPRYDLFVPLLSLPFRCNTQLQSIPVAVPYLQAGPNAVDAAIRQFASPLKVGLVWGGNPSHPRDRYRSIPLPSLLAVTRLEGVTLFSLQKGEHSRALETWRGTGYIVDLSSYLLTLADTAAAIMALDLVISVDTAVAHLAGALGQRIWTLHAHVPDWRWFRNRDDSPWYPSMRLFRQRSPGDWLHPLSAVGSALETLLAHGSVTTAPSEVTHIA